MNRALWENMRPHFRSIVRWLLRIPKNSEWQRDLSIGLERVGTILSTQGDFSGALAKDLESLAIRKKLAVATRVMPNGKTICHGVISLSAICFTRKKI